MTGQTLAHYQILEKLGSGGMGEVYKARDTRLHRAVAIKVLPPGKVANADRKRRFIQEAQSASALNHPNIVTIYDINEENGIDYMVMEYIDGKTLDAAIPRQGMRLGEALKVAIPVADGLAKAHAAGIIHRDIKPSNIMIAQDGRVKILDFGLAKLTEAAVGGEEETRTERARTEDGAILGTLYYMSPEQADAGKLDSRSDIFSFGAVLYEMVTGRRAFQRDSRISTLSAILKDEPKPPENIPADLDKIIRRSLRKDRDKRYQHMDDLKLALEEVREDSESGNSATAAQTVAKSNRLPWIAAALAIPALLAAGWWYLRPKPAESGPAELTRVTFNAGLTTSPALSPDGKLLAYASDHATNGENLDIWLQHMAGGEPIRLTRDDANESEPCFSPDGSQIAYTSSRGGIFIIPVLGGEPRQLSPSGLRPRFSPDGKSIAYYDATVSSGEGSQIWVIPAAGGSARRLASSLGYAAFPIWSPDGANLLVYASGRSGPRDWYLVPVDGGDPRRLVLLSPMRETGLAVLSAEPSSWIGDWVVFTARFSSRSQIMRVRLDQAAGKLTGKIEPVTSGTAQDQDATGAADGKIAFASVQFISDLWMLPVDANHGKVTGPIQRLTEDAALNDTASISEDGAKIAFLSNRDGKRAMWQKDMASGKLRKVSSPSEKVPEGPTFPGMTPDGRKAAFEIASGDLANRKYVLADLTDGSLREYPGRGWGISPSARFLLMYGKNSSAPIQAMRADTSERHDLMAQPKWPQRSPRFSRDERWVALHVLNTEATRQVWIVPFQFGRPAPESEWVAITDGKMLDRDPDWSPDGNLLYWLADRGGVRGIFAVKLDPSTKHPLGPAFEVKMFPGTRRSMMKFGNTAAVHPAVARDKLVFALGEETGSIWTTRLPQTGK